MRKLRVTAAILAVALVAMLCAYALPYTAARATAFAVARMPGVAVPAPDAVTTRDGSLAGVAYIPSVARNGVTIGDNQNAIGVSINGMPPASTGVATDGVMTYPSNGGSNDTVVPTPDGAQFLKVITSPSAPTDYSYTLTVPAGGKVLLADSQSSTTSTQPAAFVVNAANAVVATIGTPWAHDAAGKALPTYFTVQGTVLTQHVSRQQTGITYPIVADPYFRWYADGVVITMSYDDMQNIAAGGITAMTALIGTSIPTVVGVIPAGAISAAMAPVVGGAAWGVKNHECFWFWIPYPFVWSHPDTGTYSCH